MQKNNDEVSVLTWNINSIRARIGILNDIITRYSPDIILLQETKVTDDLFPHIEFENFNYNIATKGQKSYNGVAIFSKSIIECIDYGEFSTEARFISCFTFGLNIMSVYVINGREVGADKYFEKLTFMDNLKNILKAKKNEKTLIGGDFNITTDDFDVYDTKLWHNKITCSEAERQKLELIKDCGYTDEFRKYNSNNTYTWWDYRHQSIQKDHGLRIDYIMSSKEISTKIKSMKVLKEVRMIEKTSDHAPILCTISK